MNFHVYIYNEYWNGNKNNFAKNADCLTGLYIRFAGCVQVRYRSYF